MTTESPDVRFVREVLRALGSWWLGFGKAADDVVQHPNVSAAIREQFSGGRSMYYATMFAANAYSGEIVLAHSSAIRKEVVAIGSGQLAISDASIPAQRLNRALDRLIDQVTSSLDALDDASAGPVIPSQDKIPIQDMAERLGHDLAYALAGMPFERRSRNHELRTHQLGVRTRPTSP